jgi:Zn-dependent peptidase ImmA (M78 family)
MEMKRIAESLVRKYKTRNPIKIAEALGYIVVYAPLKGIRGFYQHLKRCTIIYISDDLPLWDAAFVCAHEIGHVLLHRGCNRVFMDTHTYFKVNKYEIEADQFALHLMYSDEDVAVFFDMSAEAFAHAAGVSTEVAMQRMKSVDIKALEAAGVLGDGDP